MTKRSNDVLAPSAKRSRKMAAQPNAIAVMARPDKASSCPAAATVVTSTVLSNQESPTKIGRLPLMPSIAPTSAVGANKVTKYAYDMVETFRRDPIQCDQFVAIGGPLSLLVFMKQWQHNEEVQEELFSCLGWFVYCFKEKNLAGKFDVFSFLRKAGVLAAIVEVMRLYPKRSVLQRNGMYMIMYLCEYAHGDNCQQQEMAYDFIHELQGISSIVAACVSHPTVDYVQKVACALLATLCHLGFYNITVMKTEALPTVALAIAVFPHDAFLVNQAADFTEMVLRAYHK
ncbi:expressed unknown protein [Seminavis robusta]|uniref:Uncharacterized protein n=1 Tax=Seminavis robusta TaxID=568900 RepID=A0A9N8HP08_9STRA|nr:expressed unknown protein [Seminavis robusta]|eukprot:Sro1134_g244920.1 n/a (287) ;mRNA; r:18193-19053